MKIKTILVTVAASLQCLASSHAAQTFVSSGQDFGPAGLQVTDQHGNKSAVAGSSMGLSTTLVIDPDNLTARLSGSSGGSTVTLSYTTGIYNQQVGTLIQFPNPPQPIYADGFSTIDITLTMNPFTFDTGIQNLAWNGESYAFPPGLIGGSSGTLAVTFSVTSEGQTSSTTESFTVASILMTSGVLNLSDYPNSASVGLGQLNDGYPRIVSLTAPNGFEASFEIIPEPSASGLAALGATLLFRRRRQRGSSNG